MIVVGINIVIRWFYLKDILHSILNPSTSEYADPKFWTQMSHELFANLYSLHEQFGTWYSLRPEDKRSPPLLCSVFIFAARWHRICGRGLNYVRRWLMGLKRIINRSLEVLAALMDKLPYVSRWLHALQNIAVHFNEEVILTAMVTCNPKRVSPPQPLQLCNSGHPVFWEKEHSLRTLLTSGLARQIPLVANEFQISNQSRLEASQQFDTIGQFTNTTLPGIGGDDMSWTETVSFWIWICRYRWWGWQPWL